MKNIAELERQKNDLRAQRIEAEKTHKTKIEALNREIALTHEEIERQLFGLDSEMIAVAATVIYVGGSYAKAGEDRGACREEAIQRILTGGGELFSEYCGTKSYDRWNGQHSNHSYGCGPRHGSILFEIGLTREVRSRDPKALTEDEINAAVYYLRNLERIQEAKAKAAQVAAA